jgi:hypothetical protein
MSGSRCLRLDRLAGSSFFGGGQARAVAPAGSVAHAEAQAAQQKQAASDGQQHRGSERQLYIALLGFGFKVVLNFS